MGFFGYILATNPPRSIENQARIHLPGRSPILDEDSEKKKKKKIQTSSAAVSSDLGRGLQAVSEGRSGCPVLPRDRDHRDRPPGRDVAGKALRDARLLLP